MRRGVIVALVFLSLGIAFAPLSNQEGCESQGYTWLNGSDYPATYSFTDDCVGCDPEGWTVDESGGVVSILSFIGSHNRVAALEDTNANSVYLYDDFTARESGTVELFMRITDMSQGAFRLALKDGADHGLIVDMRSDYWAYHDGSPNNIIPASNNEWYHLRIDFECGSGGYQGLSADTFYIYINGVRHGPYPFYTARSTLSRLSFNTDSSNSGYTGYVDAVGYFWDSDYNNGNNLHGGCCGDDVVNLKKGVVNEWHFDESSGTNAPDSISNYDGTLNNMDDSDWILGMYGNALSFDGVDDYVDAGDIDLANSDFTLAVWAKRDETGDSHYLMAQGHISTNQGIHMGFRPSNVFSCGFYYNDLDTVLTYTDTNWHHWVCTYDADTNDRRIYRDGVQVASDTASADYQNSGDPFYIGTRFGGSPTEQQYHFNGTIDEARIYNRALTDREVAYLYDTSAYEYYNHADTFSSLYDGFCYAAEYYADLDVAGDYCNALGDDFISNDWWSPAWRYRKNITITEESGRSFTDYQVQIDPGTYSTDGLAGSYHFSGGGNVVKDYSGSNNDGDLYGSTVGLWHFNENIDSSIYDASSYDNHGSITGATWVSDAISNYGLDFDGNDYLTVSDHNSLDITDEITLSAWINPDAYIDGGTGGGAFIIAKPSAYYLELTETSGVLRSYFYGISSPVYHSGTNAVPLNAWSHVAVTYDGSEIVMYINGEVDNTITGLSGSIGSSGSD
ncbi:hypothetical protein GF352_03875, partial [archaeon]|nr:hypothetical protein [archaeon]